MGESPREAVIREVREETGLAVVPTSVIGAYRSAYGTDGRYTVDVAFRCRIDGGEFSLDAGEKLDCAWVALDDMPELAFDGEREALAVLRGPRA